MTLLELLGRWLRSRGGDVRPVAAGARIELPHADPLTAAVGEHFTLAPLLPDAPAPPGVEPVYPGSRITDLFAADVEAAGGIAVIAAAPGSGLAEPRFICSFRATFVSDGRDERLFRFALTADGAAAALPAEPPAPLQPAANGEEWRGQVERLLPAATAHVRELIAAELPAAERDAQRRLYRSARRLATFYSQQRGTLAEAQAVDAEYRRRLAEEVDRHRVRVTATLIGVTVVLP